MKNPLKIIFLMVFFDILLTQASPTVVAPVSMCATSNINEHSIDFSNQCKAAVYWSIECVTPNIGCYGEGKVSLDTGDKKTIGYTAAVIVRGPYKE